MTNHVHEWRILMVTPNSATVQLSIRCRDLGCNEVLLLQNAEAMLNEHADLLEALESLLRCSEYKATDYCEDCVPAAEEAIKKAREA